jgi:acetyl-CoA synthetase
MTTSIIRKSGNPDGTASPATGWAAARARLAGLPGGGLNIAHEAVDRHVMAGHGDQTALIWLGREGDRKVISYAELAAEAARFAHVLRANGIGAGERLFLLSGRVPELYAATLGAMKAGVVVSPLLPPSARNRSARGWRSAGPHVWTAPDAQAGKLTSLCRKQSCLRPVCAA